MMTHLRMSAAVVVVLAGLGTWARAQEPAKPTEEHKVLAEDEGTWDATIKSYAAGPDAEPMVSKGSEVNTMLPGGLWMLSEFKGDFGGMAFVGRGQFGYDPVKKSYVGTWIDSMSASLSVLTGSYDVKTKTMTFTSDGVAPDGKTKYTQKMVTVMKPDGTRHFTLSMKFADAPEAKFMEVTYTKKKG